MDIVGHCTVQNVGMTDTVTHERFIFTSGNPGVDAFGVYCCVYEEYEECMKSLVFCGSTRPPGGVL